VVTETLVPARTIHPQVDRRSCPTRRDTADRWEGAAVEAAAASGPGPSTMLALARAAQSKKMVETRSDSL